MRLQTFSVPHTQDASLNLLILGGGVAGLLHAKVLASALTANHTPHTIKVLDCAPINYQKTWGVFLALDSPNANPVSAHLMPYIHQRYSEWGVISGSQAHWHHSQRYQYALIDTKAYVSDLITSLKALGVELLYECEQLKNLPDTLNLDGFKAKSLLEADLILDSRPRQGPFPAHALWQVFYGQWVESQQAVFEPSRATLMHFSSHLDQGPLHFNYVLPETPHRALVESTVFTTDRGLDKAWHRAQLEAYMDRLGASDYQVLKTEDGVLPMSMSRHWACCTQCTLNGQSVPVVPIGGRSGCYRAATGYAFQFIVEQALNTTLNASQSGFSLQRPSPYTRYETWMDPLFLTALRYLKQDMSQCFMKQFSRCEADTMVRFLTRQGTMQDCWQVVKATGSGLLAR